MTSYRGSFGLKEGNSTMSLPLDIPLIVDDIMFTMEIYVLGGAKLDGKTPMRDESFKIPTPIE